MIWQAEAKALQHSVMCTLHHPEAERGWLSVLKLQY